MTTAETPPIYAMCRLELGDAPSEFPEVFDSLEKLLKHRDEVVKLGEAFARMHMVSIYLRKADGLPDPTPHRTTTLADDIREIWSGIGAW